MIPSSVGKHTSEDSFGGGWLRLGVIALAATSRGWPGADALSTPSPVSQSNTLAPYAETGASQPHRALLERSGAALHTRPRGRSGNVTTPVPKFIAMPASETPPDHLLGSQPVLYGGLWLAKRGQEFYVRDDESAPGRNPSVLSMLEDVNRWYPELPDFGPIFACTEGYQSVCQQSAPEHNIPGEHSFAIHLDKNRPPSGWRPTPHLIPDNTFQDWALVGIDNYDDTCRNMSRVGDTPPQTALAGWVGNVETNPERRKLMEIAAANPDHIEAINTGQWKERESGDGITVSIGKRVSMPELVARYAYLIDVEGVYSSFRLKMLYHSNRPLLVQERRFDEFWTRQVRPWVHYVPVAYDLHDLFERVAWLKFNPEEGARIAGRAREYARGHLQRGHAIERWRRAIEELPPP